MEVQQLVFKNFCQHADRTLEFSPYVNLVSGPNGSGKTNIFRGILLLLTGDAGGFCNKAENIYQLSDPKAPAYIEGVVRHRGHTLEIRRGLRHSPNWLKIDDHKVAESIKDIDAAILQELGTTAHMLTNYVLVQQRQIDAWIDKTPGERAQEWLHLFGVERAKTIYDSLGRALGAITIERPVGDAAQLQMDLELRRSALADSEAQLLLYADCPDNLAQALRGPTEGLARYSQAQALDRELQRVRQELAAAHQRYQELSEQGQQEYAQLTTAHGELQNSAAFAETARQQQALWVIHQNSLDQWKRYNAEWKARKLAFQSRAKNPGRPSMDAETYLEQSRQIAVHTSNLQRLAQDVMNMQQHLQDGRCPTCHQTWPDVEAQKAQLATTAQQHADLQTALMAQKAQYQVVAEATQRYAAWQTVRSALRSQLKATRTWHDSLPKVVQPEGMSLADCLQAIQGHAGHQAAYEERLRRYNELAAESGRLQQQIHKLTADLQQRETERSQILGVTEEDAIQYRQQIASIHERHTKKMSVQYEHVRAATLVEEASSALQRYQVADQAYQRTLSTRKLLDDVRAVYHHDAAPRLVSETYLEQLEERVNETLELFNAPFRVRTDDSLGFSCTFQDGRQIVDRRLSVGQRVVLALAVRIAVNTLFAGSLGMLILDEPTEGLDSQNLDCLPVALERLRDLSQTNGLQVLFVTHLGQLAHLFDHVISL